MFFHNHDKNLLIIFMKLKNLKNEKVGGVEGYY